MTELNPSLHSIDAFDYALPEELVAQQPIEPRDASRLLVLHRAEGRWEHKSFRDLPQYLSSEDVLVANNSKVFRARLPGYRLLAGNDPLPGRRGKIEVMLLNPEGPLAWEAIMKSSGRQLPGFEFEIPTRAGEPLFGRIVRGAKETVFGTVIVEFDRDPLTADVGEIPLPHYIRRQADAADASLYQTIYAKEQGSAAAPTAGFHFTPELLQKLRAQGVGWEEVTLHIGVGTFRPVKDADIRLHPMHEERFSVSGDAAVRINLAKREGRRIVGVGTTAVRTLESAWDRAAHPPGLRAGAGRTSLFIRPGAYQFQCVDRIITNFHLPKSTLLMLVCAFAGRDLVLSAYAEAVRERYRFFSYGDAMLIL